MQTPDHLQCQRVSVGAYGRARHRRVAAADKWNQIMRAERFLLHVIFDRFNRIREIKPIIYCLPGLNEDNEHVWRALVLRSL